MAKDTAQLILDTAQNIVRNRGYSAFSYADISTQVGIRKASIHYHFPSKANLVEQLVQQYRAQMAQACDRIAQSTASPFEQLLQFAQLYQNGIAQNQICLCAMLTADFAVLPEGVQAEIRAFFQQTEAWLTALLEQGCEAGHWHCPLAANQAAKGLIALLQGAQLMARSMTEGEAAFEQMVYPLLHAQYAPA